MGVFTEYSWAWEHPLSSWRRQVSGKALRVSSSPAKANENLERNSNSPRGYPTKFYTGRLRPQVPSLTLLCTIFDTKGTRFVYLPCIHFNCCKCTVFLMWINHQTRKVSRLFYSQKVPLWPFKVILQTEMKVLLPFHIRQLVKSPPFHKPKGWKRYPFWAEPPRIGHYRKYPPPPPPGA